jgi:hypothetical protein
MDEIETQQNLRNLRILIEHTAEPDNVYSHVNIKNALMIIAAVLYGLDERLIELQQVEEDE